MTQQDRMTGREMALARLAGRGVGGNPAADEEDENHEEMTDPRDVLREITLLLKDKVRPETMDQIGRLVMADLGVGSRESGVSPGGETAETRERAPGPM